MHKPLAFHSDIRGNERSAAPPSPPIALIGSLTLAACSSAPAPSANDPVEPTTWSWANPQKAVEVWNADHPEITVQEQGGGDDLVTEAITAANSDVFWRWMLNSACTPGWRRAVRRGEDHLAVPPYLPLAKAGLSGSHQSVLPGVPSPYGIYLVAVVDPSPDRAVPRVAVPLASRFALRSRKVMTTDRSR